MSELATLCVAIHLPNQSLNKSRFSSISNDNHANTPSADLSASWDLLTALSSLALLSSILKPLCLGLLIRSGTQWMLLGTMNAAAIPYLGIGYQTEPTVTGQECLQVRRNGTITSLVLL